MSYLDSYGEVEDVLGDERITYPNGGDFTGQSFLTEAMGVDRTQIKNAMANAPAHAEGLPEGVKEHAYKN